MGAGALAARGGWGRHDESDGRGVRIPRAGRAAVMRDWSGRRYWLLGAGDALGRAMAHRLSRVGTELILSAPSLGDLGRLSGELPGRAREVVADAASRASLESVARGAPDLDGLIVMGELRPPPGERPESGDDAGEWDAARLEALCDANVTGAARAVGAVLPAMLARGEGHVVLTGLHGASRAGSAAKGYVASKAAAMALARGLRAELQGTGVEVQLVNLGPVRGRGDEDRGAALAPEDAARRIFEHLNSDAFEAGIGMPSWLTRLAG